ncbi:hypothetical protein ACHQM5_002146 [Ranunculus cassubicifolius]
MAAAWLLLGFLVLAAILDSTSVDGAIPRSSMKKIRDINRHGPYLGLVVPNAFEVTPLLQSSSFVPDADLPFFDISGRRFRVGKLGNEKVIVVMTGLSMLNAGLATELLLTLFKIKGVVHLGIAGNANPNLQIGDVVIPHYWGHTGLWNWQRYGDGPSNQLALEATGDYTRDFGYLRFADYSNSTKVDDNLLNNVWYQPEEIFPVNGIPETRQHAFWVPVDKNYFSVSKKLEGLKLESCINSTCLPRPPQVIRVERGSSANVFVDNAAYRDFLNSKFNITAVDMESAAVALVCLQERIPFIVFRALSDLAGGGSAQSNEAGIFAPLAAQNAVDVVVQFINLLS